ncbi:MAG TPA: PRC-barrel domain-containing protein [Candidatus Limnocylindrales bacterium]
MTDLLVMHDIVDGQLQSSDGRRLGRVADILCQRQDDGSLKAIALALGPEACLRRIASRFGRRAHRLFKGRFERSVEIGEVVEFGPTLRLREKADAYDVHDGDIWAAHVIRFVPGSGVSQASLDVADRGKAASAPAPRRGDVWVSDLIGTPVIDTGGREIGHVVELRIGRRHHRVNAILTGSYGWLGRLGIRTLVHRLGWWGRHEEVPWERVEEVRYDRITVQPRRASAGATVTEKR